MTPRDGDSFSESNKKKPVKKRKTIRKKKLKPVEFGTRTRPYPSFETSINLSQKGTPYTRQTLRIYANDQFPLVIHSYRKQSETMGLLYRYMPSPGMLKFFIKGLERRKPESNRRLEYIKGDPGLGKSFMAEFHASLKSKEKPIVIDCGGKNLHELLYETILDFDGNQEPIKELEKKALAGKLHPSSKTLLKQALGKAYQENNGSIRFAWDMLGNSDNTHGRENNYMIHVRDTLREVMENEKIKGAGVNPLGLITRPGPIYRAFKENRPIVLDEYNKSKEGTDDCMQRVLQFLAGEIDEVTVTNELKNANEDGGQEYTLRREDMGDNFFATFTGNAVEDGITTRELSESANSRLQPWVLPRLTKLDWEHRFSQLLVGLPVSTLYKMKQDKWDANPQEFTEYLHSRLTEGLTAREKKKIPAQTFILLEHWQELVKFTDRISSFLQKTYQLMDPNLENAEGDIIEELDQDEFRKEIGFGFRTIIELIEESKKEKARSIPADQLNGDNIEIGSYAKKSEKIIRLSEPEILNLGNRILDELKKKVVQISFERGKKDFGAKLFQLGQQYGIFESFDTETNNHKKTIAYLLNINPNKGKTIDQKARIIQKQFADHLRLKNAALQTKSNEEIIPKAKVKSLLLRIETMDQCNNPFERSIIIINENPNNYLRLSFMIAATKDNTTSLKEDGSLSIRDIFIPPEKLMNEESFLKTLNMPVVGNKNLKAMWNKALSSSGAVSTSGIDNALNIAENNHSHYAITTVMVESKGKEVPMHIILNNRTGKTIIIGEKADLNTQQSLICSRIEFISRHDKQAIQKVQAALHDVITQNFHENENNLKTAFLMRNWSSKTPANDQNRSLADLLTAKDIECFNKHYITKEKGKFSATSPKNKKNEQGGKPS